MEVDISNNINSTDNSNISNPLFKKDKTTIQEGDIVLVMEGKDSYKQIIVQSSGHFQNKFGHFSYSDLIGKSLGSKINTISKCKKKITGFVTVVDFIPALWEKAIDRLTQILFNPDISLILGLLNIRNDSIVLESGTGSGCLSINISNCLDSNFGHLYTFEFNKERADKLKQMFKDLNLDKKITVTNQDVVECGFHLDRESIRTEEIEKAIKYRNKFKDLHIEDKSIDCLLDGIVDCIFIDLPSPWLVISSCLKKLKNNGTLVSFSPCIEQVEKTFVEMKDKGFINPRMFEIPFRSHNFIKTEKVKIPSYNESYGINNDLYTYEELNINSSRNDMRGHTGFLVITTKP